MVLTNLFPLTTIVSLIISAAGERPWWDIIPEGFRLIFSLTLFLVNLLILAVVVYLAGLVVVGRKRALLSDALVISLLGTVLSTLFFMFIPYRLLALALSVLAWLLLIKSLYETGWLGAIAVSILTVIIYLALTMIVALIFGVIERVWDLLFPSFILFFGSA